MTLAQPTPPVPLIIDTDTAQDDCVAIIAAMMDDAADLRAITMVAGNVVALDPGGFWNDTQVRIFNASITASIAWSTLLSNWLYGASETPLFSSVPR